MKTCKVYDFKNRKIVNVTIREKNGVDAFFDVDSNEEIVDFYRLPNQLMEDYLMRMLIHTVEEIAVLRATIEKLNKKLE